MSFEMNYGLRDGFLEEFTKLQVVDGTWLRRKGARFWNEVPEEITLQHVELNILEWCDEWNRARWDLLGKRARKEAE